MPAIPATKTKGSTPTGVNAILLGPPGSGKGTQVWILVKDVVLIRGLKPVTSGVRVVLGLGGFSLSRFGLCCFGHNGSMRFSNRFRT